MNAQDTQQTVSFTAMEHGTKDDYGLVFAHEQEQLDTQADRVMEWLRQMDGPSPYKISRSHSMTRSACVSSCSCSCAKTNP